MENDSTNEARVLESNNGEGTASDNNEKCKLVLVVRTGLGMTKGMHLSFHRSSKSGVA